MSDLCATPPKDLLELAELIEKARQAYLDAIERDSGAWVRRLALAEILWDDKGTFAPALRQAALYPAAAAEIERLRSDVPVAWMYEVLEVGDSWSKHLSFDPPAGNKRLRGIIPLYAAPQPQPDVKPPAAADKDYRWRDGPSPLDDHDAAVEREAARRSRKISGAE